VLVTFGLVGLCGLVGVFDDGGQPCGNGVDVAEHVGIGQRFGQRGGRRLDLAGVAGSGFEPALHESDLGVQIVEASAEVRERRFGVARLP
jgi:hypothetical protein